MSRYVRSKRRKRRGSSLRRKSATHREPRMQTRAVQKDTNREPKRQSALAMFLRKNIKVVAIVGLVVVAGAVALGIVFGGRETTGVPGDTVQASAPLQTDVSEDEYSEYSEEIGYDYDDVEDSVLAGLTGSDDSLFSEMEDDMEEAIFAEEGIRIGVTIGDLKSDTDKMLLGRLEQASNAAEVGKLVYDVYYYNAQGDSNQQLQDVRSLIKNDVDAIIVGGTTKESFDMVVALANDAGIPVVAYNAPQGATGHAINIVADQADWGGEYGEFMAQNLTQGSIVQVLGSDDNELDLARAAAINAALATNENISTKDTLYEKWDSDDAYDAMVEYLDEDGYVPGIITEEGMALGILDAFIETGRLPIVMCGDASAGFIKAWYSLKTTGIDITPEPEDDEEVATVILKAKVNEMIVIAQPAPVSIGAVAFEVALRLAQGSTMKVFGQTYVYNVETIITDSNLPTYFALVRDEKDDYIIRDIVSQETLDSLLNPPEVVEEEDAQE